VGCSILTSPDRAVRLVGSPHSVSFVRLRAVYLSSHRFPP
jgi:hypothetical protein